MCSCPDNSTADGGLTPVKPPITNTTDVVKIVNSKLEKEEIINEILNERKGKTITRFISTHPDKDHLLGLYELDDAIEIINFYCVKNKISLDDGEDFNKYCELILIYFRIKKQENNNLKN